MSMPSVKIWMTPRGCFTQVLEPEGSRVSALRQLSSVVDTCIQEAPLVVKRPDDTFGCVIIKSSVHKKMIADYFVCKHASAYQAMCTHNFFKEMLDAFRVKSQ